MEPAKVAEALRTGYCDIVMSRSLSPRHRRCLPAAPGIAPRTDASPEDVVRNRDRVLCLTSTAGLARLPQITLPLGQLSGCPLGLSLMGGPGSDLSLLAFAESLCGPLSWPPENIGS